MITKQLNGYKVEFYSEEEWNKDISMYPEYKIPFGEATISRFNNPEIVTKISKGIINPYLYVGLATEIPEELAERIVDKITEDDWDEIELSLPIEERFSGYRDYQDRAYSRETAKDSFKTLSNLPYCVIIKNK